MTNAERPGGERMQFILPSNCDARRMGRLLARECFDKLQKHSGDAVQLITSESEKFALHVVEEAAKLKQRDAGPRRLDDAAVDELRSLDGKS